MPEEPSTTGGTAAIPATPVIIGNGNGEEKNPHTWLDEYTEAAVKIITVLFSFVIIAYFGYKGKEGGVDPNLILMYALGAANTFTSLYFGAGMGKLLKRNNGQ